jgi:hypothetical protein
MAEIKNPAGLDRNQGAGTYDTKNINYFSGGVNRYTAFYERMRLARCLIYRSLPRFKFPFADHRHKIIYSNLESFLHNFPPAQCNGNCFISYLAQSGALKQCGGLAYIRAIFGECRK